jgi:hypothetical protein
MDGPDGELHPIRGADWVRTLFGDEWGEICLFHSGTMVKRWNAVSKEEHSTIWGGNMRIWAEREPSKLYAVDKLGSPLYPAWLYKLLSGWSSEWKEYATIHFGGAYYRDWEGGEIEIFLTEKDDPVIGSTIKSFGLWHPDAMKRMKARAFQHKKNGNWMTMQEAVKKEW